MDPGAMTVTPEEMARGLSILTGFRASDLLGVACAVLALTEDDPRCKRIGQALWRGLEAEESGDHEAALKHDQEFITELLRLTQ